MIKIIIGIAIGAALMYVGLYIYFIVSWMKGQWIWKMLIKSYILKTNKIYKMVEANIDNLIEIINE
jgi:hypothetical protein